MKTPIEYQRLLQTSGVSLSALGIIDIALNREDAIRAIELLRSSAIPVLGGDVYVKTANAVELAYANWHSDPTTGETRAQFVERSSLEGKRYIAEYPSSEQTPLFGLVFGE